MVPNWFIKDLVVCRTVLESFEYNVGLSPGSGFLYVADISISVMKGDVRHNQLTSTVWVAIRKPANSWWWPWVAA